ncbi:MAG TPA: multicopper oxidase [Terriglobia bacterium]|nr:multicopper oxidase [Terriglobia bacterium]
MVGRRYFIKVLATGGAGLFLRSRGWEALAEIPGGTLSSAGIPKYVTPMLIPPVMPVARTIVQAGRSLDYYEISVRQFKQQILPSGLPSTTVWGYGPETSIGNRGPLLHNAPSLTIEAKWQRPVRVRWINGLVDANGDYLPHLLPVDPTLHWANPPGGGAGRDSRPTFAFTPLPYTGPVPLITHVHGAVNVGDESDGYAEAWYLPAARNIPAGHATEGTWYDFFKGKAQAKFGAQWGPGNAVFQYPNANRASTAWYHDHTLGMTRLNVYAGPAGFYIIRGGPDGDAAVRDSRFQGQPARLPGPAPSENDRFPSNRTIYEIPIAIQDRSFNADGSLFYPNTREFFDGVSGPYIPFTDVSPIWNPEFFGNVIMVNGNTWPFQQVEKRRYRFRFLNGCQSRFLILDFNDIPGVEVCQIGNEGGFLAAPVNIRVDHGNRILLAPAERADVIVDFTFVPVGNYVLRNVGPDEPFGGGVPEVDFEPADSGTTGQVLQFRVVPSVGHDTSTPAEFLELPSITPLPAETVTRPVALIEEMSAFFDDAPSEALLGKIDGDPSIAPGVWLSRMWEDTVTENPEAGAVEVWEIYNATADAHPIHIHEGVFEVVNRQNILVNEADETVQVSPGSSATPPEPWETGVKDTVIAYPGQVTRIRMKFEVAGQYVWHCHIVEHEDNEMMRPYRIGPVQPGQPE